MKGSGYIKAYSGDVHSHAGRAHFYKLADWKRLREQVLERDHHECQWCKAEGRVTTDRDAVLEVEHIKTLEERPDLALNPDNTRTLCRDCHNKRHGRFSYKRLGPVSDTQLRAHETLRELV